MQLPLVSVIIATYNGKEKWFTQTVDSILNQSYKNIELLIINDASINNIDKVILGYCKKYKNIVYLKNEKNCERSYSRNRGIFESRGKYIAFCDDDDIRSDKDKIKKQVEFLENNEDYVLCGTSMIEIDDENNILKTILFKKGNKNIREIILQSNQFGLSTVMIRKDVLLFSGLFNSDFNKVEDYDLRLRIGRYGKVENLDTFVYYRTWIGNTSTTSKFQQKKLSFKSMWINRKYYPNLFRAVIFRIGGFIVPERIVNFILKTKNRY